MGPSVPGAFAHGALDKPPHSRLPGSPCYLSPRGPREFRKQTRRPPGGAAAGVGGRRADRPVQRASEEAHPPPPTRVLVGGLQGAPAHLKKGHAHCWWASGELGRRGLRRFLVRWVLPGPALSFRFSVFRLRGRRVVSLPCSLICSRCACQCSVSKWKLLSFDFSDGAK